MKQINKLNNWINLNSRMLLLLSASILAVWGLWVLSEACVIFQSNLDGNIHTNSYIFYKQTGGVLLGICLLFIIYKVNIDRVVVYPLIWILLAGIILFYNIHESTTKYIYLDFLDLSLRSGMLVTFIFVFYFTFNLKKEKVYRVAEIAGLTLLVILFNFIIAGYGDFIMAFIFTLSCFLVYYFTGRGKITLWFVPLNILLLIFIMLISNYGRNSIFNIYFSNELIYQLSQSLHCFVDGALWGIGPVGNIVAPEVPVQASLKSLKLPYHLPDFHGGFIFSFIGLQWGLVGIILSVILFLLVILLGLKAAKQSKTKGDAILVFITTIIFTILVFTGMATPLKLLPPNGEGLPFFSYGISKIMFAFFTIAIIYKNLSPTYEEPNYLNINIRKIFLLIICLFILIPLTDIYYLIKWNIFKYL